MRNPHFSLSDGDIVDPDGRFEIVVAVQRGGVTESLNRRRKRADWWESSWWWMKLGVKLSQQSGKVLRMKHGVL